MANTTKKISVNAAKNVAVIMDGNGRWAISNSLNISKGHSKGVEICLLYTSPSPRDATLSRMPSSA